MESIEAPVLKGDQWTGNDRKGADMSVYVFNALNHVKSGRIEICRYYIPNSDFS